MCVFVMFGLCLRNIIFPPFNGFSMTYTLYTWYIALIYYSCYGGLQPRLIYAKGLVCPKTHLFSLRCGDTALWNIWSHMETWRLNMPDGHFWFTYFELFCPTWKKEREERELSTIIQLGLHLSFFWCDLLSCVFLWCLVCVCVIFPCLIGFSMTYTWYIALLWRFATSVDLTGLHKRRLFGERELDAVMVIVSIVIILLQNQPLLCSD